MPLPVLLVAGIAARGLVRKYGKGALRRAKPILKSSYAYTKNLFNRAGARAKQIYEGKGTIVNPAQVVTKQIEVKKLTKKTGKHQIKGGKKQYEPKTVRDNTATMKKIRETAKIDKRVRVGGAGIYIADSFLFPDTSVIPKADKTGGSQKPLSGKDLTIKELQTKNAMLEERLNAKPQPQTVDSTANTKNDAVMKNSGAIALDTTQKIGGPDPSNIVTPYHVGRNRPNQAYASLEKRVKGQVDYRAMNTSRSLLRG